MSKHNFWKYFPAIFALLALLNISIFADTIAEKSFDVSAGGTLFIESDLGAIDVETSDQQRVDVKVITEKRGGRERDADIAKRLTIDFQKDGNDIKVKAWLKKKRDWHGDKLRLSFIVTVPHNYNVDLSTGGGSISVGDLTGQVEARTSGGSLNFGNINGPVKGHTSGGSITVESCEGNVDITTSGGSISLGDINGDANVRTSGGSINIEKSEGHVFARTSGGSINVEEVMGDIEARTSGGSVKAYISKQPGGDCRLETSGGSVTVYLAKNIGVDVEASASSGRVISDFDIDGREKKNYVNGKINGGGPNLYLRTSSGKVKIRRM